VLALAAVVPAASGARTAVTITVSSVSSPFVRHAHPPAGDVGDELSSTLVLLDPRTHAKVGTMAYAFTIFKVCAGFSASCDPTVKLTSTTTFRDGTIRANGGRVSIAHPTIVVKVRGGTGRYEGATGTLSFGPASTRTNVYRLTLP
jgi:hypothetical protein